MVREPNDSVDVERVEGALGSASQPHTSGKGGHLLQPPRSKARRHGREAWSGGVVGRHDVLVGVDADGVRGGRQGSGRFRFRILSLSETRAQTSLAGTAITIASARTGDLDLARSTGERRILALLHRAHGLLPELAPERSTTIARGEVLLGVAGRSL